NPSPQEYELSTLQMTRWLAPAGAETVDTDLVRSVAAEFWALIDQPEKALAVAAQVHRPMNRFPALARAAQGFGRARRLEPVQRIWTMLKELGSDKYVGAAAERCAIMLRMVSAFLPFGDANQIKAPMSAALVFAVDLHGLIAAAEGKVRQQKLLEDLTKTHTGRTALSMIQARAHVQEAMLKYWQDDGAASAMGDEVRRDIEQATPESWNMKPEPFQGEHAMAFCV